MHNNRNFINIVLPSVVHATTFERMKLFHGLVRCVIGRRMWKDLVASNGGIRAERGSIRSSRGVEAFSYRRMSCWRISRRSKILQAIISRQPKSRSHPSTLTQEHVVKKQRKHEIATIKTCQNRRHKIHAGPAGISRDCVTGIPWTPMIIQEQNFFSCQPAMCPQPVHGWTMNTLQPVNNRKSYVCSRFKRIRPSSLGLWVPSNW